MNIIKLKHLKIGSENTKLNQIYIQFGVFLNELRKKELPETVVSVINQHITELNNANLSEDEFRKLIKKKQTAITGLLEKELKIVPKNYYRNIWLAVGMTVFGIPLGVLFGVMLGNSGLFMLGLPAGVAIGLIIGTAMDKKALKENRQLDIEIKY